MTIQKHIKEYIATLPEAKRSDMHELNNTILKLMPKCKLWFLDGKELGKASVTGYCIKFKKLEDIDIDTLKAAIQYGFEQTYN